jgi:hypothetical protein
MGQGAGKPGLAKKIPSGLRRNGISKCLGQLFSAHFELNFSFVTVAKINLRLVCSQFLHF